MPAPIAFPSGKNPEQLEFYDVATGHLVSVMAIEIEPGRYEILEPNLVPPDVLPRYGICEWMRQGDNSWKAIAITHGSQIKLTEDIARQLGIKGENSHRIYKTMKRLFWAGFISGRQITADSYYLDLHSLFAFFRQVSNPGWWTKARIDHYREYRDPPLEDPSGEFWKTVKAKVRSFFHAA